MLRLTRIALLVLAVTALSGAAELAAQAGYGDREAGQAVAPGEGGGADEELIASAMAAAPPAVSRDATVMVVGENGELKTIRRGTGNFTCIPDGPSPGEDPMCVDENGLEFVKAWLAREDPPTGKIGFGYMLRGGSDASNEDPFATEPAPGHEWVDTGPHVMVLNTAGLVEGYPRTHEDTSRPYVMWPGTPYEHLMIPVQ